MSIEEIKELFEEAIEADSECQELDFN